MQPRKFDSLTTIHKECRHMLLTNNKLADSLPIVWGAQAMAAMIKMHMYM